VENDRLIAVALAACSPNIEYFAEQLASIRAQSYRNWRCIVTLDSPFEELAGELVLADYFGDERFAWYANSERLGVKRNFERAIQIGCGVGAWAIATCDQDDVWYVHKLATLAAALKAAPPLSVVHSDMHLLDARGGRGGSVWQTTRQRVTDASPADLLVANVVTGCSMLLDADLGRRYSRIPESFSYHDHWYAIAASCHGGVHAVQQPLLAYRQHGGNVLGAIPFEWRVDFPTVGSLGRYFASMRHAYRLLRRRTTDALDAGVPLPRNVVRRYVDGADLGLSLFARGILRAMSNPRLSRHLLFHAIGQIADLVPGS
jgi:hypothetical protein